MLAVKCGTEPGLIIGALEAWISGIQNPEGLILLVIVTSGYSNEKLFYAVIEAEILLTNNSI
jgi:hypothetical protein